MKPTSRSPGSDARKGASAKQRNAISAQQATKPKLSDPDVFISLANQSRSPEQRRARIESVLKLVGLPNLDELNRMDVEATGRPKPRRAKDAET